MSKDASELWAVVDKVTRQVKYTRGGSSTMARLMVYTSKEKAEKVLKNPWIKQVIKDISTVEVVNVYCVREYFSTGTSNA